MVGELDIQRECQKRLCELVREMAKKLVDDANEIKNRDPKVEPRGLVLYTTVAKLADFSRVILHIRNIGAIDEMQILLRSMVEMAVNACYLQDATEEELKHFFYFDPINNLIAMQDFERASGGQLKIPDKLKESVTKKAQDAHEESGLPLDQRM